jgi:hypothetical protein
MNRMETLLVWWLRICAAVLLLAAPAIFLPFGTMKAINDALGLAPLPDTPLLNYLTRSISALYVYQGALNLILSFDIRRHRPLIVFVAWANVTLGVFLLVLDPLAGMPLYWTLLEGPVVLAAGAVMLWLLRQVP